MNIVIQNANQLVIKENRPNLQWVMLTLAIILMIGGLLASFISPVNTKYSCDKKYSACTISKYYVLRNPDIEMVNIDEIDKASYKVYTSKGSTSCYVYFLVKKKEVILENCTDNNDGEIKAAQINNYISDPKQSTISNAQDNTLIGFIFVFGMLVISGILLIKFFKAKILYSIFDKPNSTLNIVERSLFAKNTTSHQLNDITKVSIINENKYKDKGNVSGGNTRLELLTSSGDYIPLSINFSEGDKDKKQIAKTIRTFLSLN